MKIKALVGVIVLGLSAGLVPLACQSAGAVGADTCIAGTWQYNGGVPAPSSDVNTGSVTLNLPSSAGGVGNIAVNLRSPELGRLFIGDGPVWYSIAKPGTLTWAFDGLPLTFGEIPPSTGTTSYTCGPGTLGITLPPSISPAPLTFTRQGAPPPTLPPRPGGGGGGGGGSGGSGLPGGSFSTDPAAGPKIPVPTREPTAAELGSTSSAAYEQWEKSLAPGDYYAKITDEPLRLYRRWGPHVKGFPSNLGSSALGSRNGWSYWSLEPYSQQEMIEKAELPPWNPASELVTIEVPPDHWIYYGDTAQKPGGWTIEWPRGSGKILHYPPSTPNGGGGVQIMIPEPVPKSWVVRSVPGGSGPP